jgi:hypothetical protein
MSAFTSFCRRAGKGQFPDLKDRDGLWALLVVLTARKAADLVKHQHRKNEASPHGAELDSDHLLTG